MAEYLIQDTALIELANIIRKKNNYNSSLTLNQIVNEVDAIASGEL